jgi:hypothetical protein
LPLPDNGDAAATTAVNHLNAALSQQRTVSALPSSCSQAGASQPLKRLLASGALSCVGAGGAMTGDGASIPPQGTPRSDAALPPFLLLTVATAGGNTSRHGAEAAMIAEEPLVGPDRVAAAAVAGCVAVYDPVQAVVAPFVAGGARAGADSSSSDTALTITIAGATTGAAGPTRKGAAPAPLCSAWHLPPDSYVLCRCVLELARSLARWAPSHYTALTCVT